MASLTATLASNLLDQGLNFLGGAIGLPGFQDGGFVPGPPGAPMLAVVHGEELVLNPRQQEQFLGTGVTIIQNLTGDVNEATRRAMLNQGDLVGRLAIGQLREQRLLGVR